MRRAVLPLVLRFESWWKERDGRVARALIAYDTATRMCSARCGRYSHEDALENQQQISFHY
jgi:hypothetical protein